MERRKEIFNSIKLSYFIDNVYFVSICRSRMILFSQIDVFRIKHAATKSIGRGDEFENICSMLL